MGEVTINNSPIHSQSIITYPYGIIDASYSCGWHTGVDFAPYGQTEANPLLYSPVSGEVVYTNNSDDVALGVQTVILDNNNKYWRFCHMVLNSLQVQVGDIVTKNSIIGTMGDTGNASGVHLHLEYSTTFAWQCNTFLNPSVTLGIPNEIGTIVNYSQSPIPPFQVPEKKKFPWVLYARKLRNRHIL